MKETTNAKSILRLIRVAAVLQMATVFLAWAFLTRKIFSISSSLRDVLYGAGATAEDVNKVNRAFSSITTDLVWILIVGIVLTGAASSLLAGAIKKNWPKGNGGHEQDY